MTARKIRIKQAVRYPIEDEQDTLEFKPGVNVIVGELQAGKTTWLRMIDYVLGDTGKVDEAFDSALAQKYERIAVTLVIDGDEIVVERRWKEVGTKSKVLVDGEKMAPLEFSTYLLERLNIPLIHIPSGNPYERSWHELSWRELFRHIYKQERQWSGFAEKQPEVTRSACILHFLGAATSLYPEEFMERVAKKKEMDRLEAQKDVFVGVMQDLAVDLVGQPGMTVAVTPDSVATSRQRLRNRLVAIETQRAALFDDFDRQDTTGTTVNFDAMRERLLGLHGELGKAEAQRNDTARRQAELVAYAASLTTELERLARAKAGASVFADLRVTHCPACDQEVPDRTCSTDRCSVCGQIHVERQGDNAAGTRRIEFEEQQVAEEREELNRLIGELDQEIKALSIQIATINHRISTETRTVAAAQSLAVRAVPPDIALLDQEVGQIDEQLQQLDRVERAIGSRDDMNAKITALHAQITELDIQIKRLTPTIDFGFLGDLIADRMNDYLNLVNTDNLSRWKTGRVTVRLRREDFEVYLDNQRWTVKAGGTAACMIQIAYHYALLSLTKDREYSYPGFLIIDFPPQFLKAGDLRDSENYLLKPFVDLCATKEMAESQVIIAGRAFDNLLGAHMVRLS